LPHQGLHARHLACAQFRHAAHHTFATGCVLLVCAGVSWLFGVTLLRTTGK